jgi:micrococcal nuclease
VSPLPPPGWYADPERPRAWRYWDGAQWTAHREPMTGPVAAPASPPRRIGLPSRILLVTAAVLGAGMVGTVAVALAVAPASAPTQPPSSRPTAAQSPSASTTAASAAGPTRAAAPTRRTTTAPARSARATAPKKTAPVGAGLVAVVGVVDGDTIKVRLNGSTERVRVIGIDTPELSPRECYAQQAASRMQSLVQSKHVRLAADPTQDDRDRYDRLLRHVFLTDGRSVAQLLIAGGYGQEYTYDRAYAGQAAHLQAQRAAKAGRLGIWSSGCAGPVAPAPSPPAPVAPAPQPPVAPQTCAIKGNISSEGEKIYHVPGGAFYNQTQISLSKGERWFCSESEAVGAGWRASKR